jgi:8-oxo-dGTP pyrophosphatase MutT (NUDIX family)
MEQMYKVFLNERLIEITAPGKITINKPTFFFDENAGKKEVKKWFNSFLTHSSEEVVLVHPEPHNFFEIFKSAFKMIEAAGGIVISEGKLLVIYRRDKWDLPKGKIDKGETPEIAAVREVAEECGIAGHKIVKVLSPTFHLYPFPGNKEKWVFKKTFWFEMNYDGELTGTPQTEEDISEVKWISLIDLDEILENTYSNLVPIFQIYRA